LGFIVGVTAGAVLGFAVGVTAGAVVGFAVGVTVGAVVGFTIVVAVDAAVGVSVDVGASVVGLAQLVRISSPVITINNFFIKLFYYVSSRYYKILSTVLSILGLPYYS
jgi:hypothetical protein